MIVSNVAFGFKKYSWKNVVLRLCSISLHNVQHAYRDNSMLLMLYSTWSDVKFIGVWLINFHGVFCVSIVSRPIGD